MNEPKLLLYIIVKACSIITFSLDFLARDVKKIPTCITGLWQAIDQSDVAFLFFDVGSCNYCEVGSNKRLLFTCK